MLNDPKGSISEDYAHAVPDLMKNFKTVQASIQGAEGSTRQNLVLFYADSLELWQQGLSHIDDPGLFDHDGMLFDLLKEVQAPFWMKETWLPLSVAFLDAGLMVRSVVDMDLPEAGEENPKYLPAAPYQYALEVVSSRRKELGIFPGAILSFSN